jgi:hypothetical protein
MERHNYYRWNCTVRHFRNNIIPANQTGIHFLAAKNRHGRMTGAPARGFAAGKQGGIFFYVNRHYAITCRKLQPCMVLAVAIEKLSLMILNSEANVLDTPINP